MKNPFKKKLSLNKETITILDKKKLEKIVGGIDTLIADDTAVREKTKADSIAARG